MLKLLYIEDDPADYQLLVDHLQRQGVPADVMRVGDRSGVAAALEEGGWDAVLADYSVPGLPFRETLALLVARIPDCPLILISSPVGDEAAVELLKEGAWDFVLKENLERLRPAIERGLRESTERQARRLTEAKLRQAATVFESTQDAVMITDLESRILAINKAFTEITGYSEAEAIDKKARINGSGRQDENFYKALWAKLLGTGHWQGEVWNHNKRGEVYPAWLTISTARDAAGRPTHYVGVFSDISALERNEAQLARLAHYDTLTDLPNRLLMHSRLEQAIGRAARHGKRVAVLFIDLDGFKAINVSFGHLSGDRLLVAVARRLRDRVRDEDMLGRFGADEFLLMLEPIGEPGEAALVARDILAVLEAPFALAPGSEAYIGASIGISVFPEDGSSAEELARNADTALRQAKEQGRNRVCFYTADMNVYATAQLALGAALRRALERQELLLHFQPKVNLRSGTIVGAEALIRWQRDDELLSAGEFIPLAEKTGLISTIGAWVIDAACRQLALWHDAGWPALRLSVNVSGRQFGASDLPALVSEALARHRVPASCLELEMTESMLIDDPEQTIATLKALKRIGVKLSLDDFGTGYSSFAYLSRFPIDTLKIDQSFVRSLVSDPESAIIAVSIIDLAHRMSLKVVAEGVETAAQLSYLRLRNCDEIQGFVFAAAMPEAAFTTLLRDGKSLPVTAQGASARELADRRNTPTARAAPARRQRTLLLVDDDRDALEAQAMLLELDNYRVLTAQDGNSGLELLAQNEVDVIISDQRMPGMPGTEFLRRVKTIHPQTARILVSGFNELESIAEAINDGSIYKFLRKPVGDALLRANIEEAFRHKELADENHWLHARLQTTSRELAQAQNQLREVHGKRHESRRERTRR